MSRDEKIKQLIEELIQIEPEFSGKEKVLTEVLSEMASLSERVHIDDAFRKELKQRLLKASVEEEKTSFIKELFTMKKLSFALAAVALVIAGAAGTGVYYRKYNVLNSGKQAIELFSSDTKITKNGKNAFGSLAQTANERGAGMGGENAAVSSEAAIKRPQSGGGNGNVPPVTNPVAPTQTADMAYGMGGGTSMIAPYYPVKYVYKGEKLDLSQAEGEVFRRVKGNNSGPVADVLKSLSLGLIDLNKFTNTNVESFTLVENRDNGYMVSVSTQEGMINVYQNYQKWPTIQYTDNYRMGQKDVLPDEELFSIANKFLADYGVSTSNYDAPVVQKFWNDPVVSSRSSMEIYIPEVVSIIYPTKINGEKIVDEGGNYTGLNVSIDMRRKVVTSLNELVDQNYESSSYALETDTARILKFAESGGGYMNIYDSQTESQRKEVTLGTPTRGLVRTWIYDENQGKELYVPALIFPVTSALEDNAYYTQKQVIVPLVKEVLDSRSKQGQPIPYDLPAATQGSAEGALPPKLEGR